MAHILVLDDVEDAAVMIKRILERKGHRLRFLPTKKLPLPMSRRTR